MWAALIAAALIAAASIAPSPTVPLSREAREEKPPLPSWERAGERGQSLLNQCIQPQQQQPFNPPPGPPGSPARSHP